MDGSFACPDCGCVIALTGLAPGRQARCDWCRSVVEVPYIPRADQIKRRRTERARPWAKRLPGWTVPLGALLVIAIVAAGAARVVRTRLKSAECDAISRLVQSASSSESAGKYGDALVSLEGAISLARPLRPPPCDMDALRDRRDALARKDLQARLDRLKGVALGDLGQAVGEALTLEARAWKDPALGDFSEPVATMLGRLRLQWAESDGVAAEEALSEGQIEKALDLAQRQYRTAEHLPKAESDRLQSEAREQAARIIGQYGAVIEPISGRFTLGSSSGYEARIRPPLVAGLRLRGYLPKPPGALWDDLWDTASPYRVTFVVNESQDDSYLQTPNRISQIDARLTVTRKNAPAWFDTPRGLTQVPLPKTPAYQASRLATSAHRSAEFERLLYDNAAENLLERLQVSLKNLPTRPS